MKIRWLLVVLFFQLGSQTAVAQNFFTTTSPADFKTMIPVSAESYCSTIAIVGGKPEFKYVNFVDAHSIFLDKMAQNMRKMSEKRKGEIDGAANLRIQFQEGKDFYHFCAYYDWVKTKRK